MPGLAPACTPGKLQGVQIARGVAALAVVLFHLGGAIASQKYFAVQVFSGPFRAGYAGVYLFFVLSGFIITFVHFDDFGRMARLPSYVFKRCARIYPVYFIIFGAVFLVAMAVPSAAGGLPTDIGVIIKSLLLIPQDKDVIGGTGAPVLVVAWSLQYEMVFYALFGLAIIGRGVAVAAGLGVLLLSIVGGRDSVPFGFLELHYFALFAFGVGVAIAVRRGWFARAVIPAIIIGAGSFILHAALIATGAGVIDDGAELFGPAGGAIGFGVSSSLLIFGLVMHEQAGWRPNAPFWLLLGEASYVLYLLHFPMVSVMCKLAMAVGLKGIVGASVTWCVTLGVCICTALLFHLLVERRLNSFLGGALKRRAWLAATER